MDVRIDQGAESFDALKPRIEIETQLARQRQVGALSCGGDDPIDRADPPQSFGCLARSLSVCKRVPSRLNRINELGDVATISGRGRKLENLPAAKEAVANRSAEADHIAQRTRSAPRPGDPRGHLRR